MSSIQEFLEISAARHNHLCPRQILGARIGLAGAQAVGLKLPVQNHRLLVILETDGCFADGIEATTSCSVGHRTLRIVDYGKIAATFVDIRHGRAVRVAPRLDARERVVTYAPGEPRHYFAQLTAYQVMPDVELLSIQEVFLNNSIKAIISRPGVRVNCDLCGEEIINEREISYREMTLCQACARGAYYQSLTPLRSFPIPIFDLAPVVDKQS